jgi:hypothetical protein
MRAILVLGTWSSIAWAQPRVEEPRQKEVFAERLLVSGIAAAPSEIELALRADSTENLSFPIAWAIGVSYKTRGKVQLGTRSFGTTSMPGVQRTFEMDDLGGKIDILIGQYGSARGSTAVVAYGAGFDTRPHKADIKTLLESLYTATAGFDSLQSDYPAASRTLASCIPAAESSYRQFVSITHPTYRIRAWWPNDNVPTGGIGDFVGLMQVPTTMEDAFNWTENAKSGAIELADKIRVSRLYVANRRAENPSLRDPGVSKIEDIALGYYSAYGNGTSSSKLQYWTPNAQAPHATDWVLSANAGLRAYVGRVRTCD